MATLRSKPALLGIADSYIAPHVQVRNRILQTATRESTASSFRTTVNDQHDTLMRRCNDNIADLINELKLLKVRESQIIEALQRENESIQRERHQGQQDIDVSDSTTTSSSVTDSTVGFAPGDRVCITNKVRKPQNWDQNDIWNEDKARIATVTNVEPGKVHFVSDIGVRTWQAPGNLKRI